MSKIKKTESPLENDMPTIMAHIISPSALPAGYKFVCDSEMNPIPEKHFTVIVPEG